MGARDRTHIVQPQRIEGGTVFSASAVEEEVVGQVPATQADCHGERDEDGPSLGWFGGFVLI
jgi:hypothetical protein